MSTAEQPRGSFIHHRACMQLVDESSGGGRVLECADHGHATSVACAASWFPVCP
jgi:hypothetical protein